MRAGAALVLLLVGCATPPAPPPSAEFRTAPEDDDLLAAVPAEADVVLAVDLAQLRKSPWTRELVVTAAGARARRQGFDEATDVDRLIVAQLPGGASLSVVQGRFDRARVAAAFREGKGEVASDTFRDCPIWTSGVEAVAFLTRRTLLSGPLTAVRGAIDSALGRARDIRGEAWLRQTRQQGAGLPAAEIAIKVSDEMRALIHEDLAEAEALEQVGGRLQLGGGLEISLKGATATGSQARSLAARLQETAGALSQRPSLTALGLAPVLARAQIAVKGTEIAAGLRLSESDRDDIAARWSTAARLIARAREDANRNATGKNDSGK
jgi:hypothetical protein